MRSKHWSRAILLTLLINDATVDKEAPSVFQQEDDEWGEGSGAELCQEETLGARVEDLRLSVLFLFPPTLEGLSLWREGEFSAARGQNTNWVWARNKKATDGFKNHYQHAASRLAFSQYIDFKLMNLPFKTQTVGVITCSSLISLSGFVIDFLLMKTNQSVVRSKFSKMQWKLKIWSHISPWSHWDSLIQTAASEMPPKCRLDETVSLWSEAAVWSNVVGRKCGVKHPEHLYRNPPPP